jgi:hypothetical protein
MRTAVIRVGEPAAVGSPYPVELFTDAGSTTWLDVPIATASMPADLADPTPPTDKAGQPLAMGGIVPYVLGETDATASFLSIGQYLHRQVTPGAVGDAWRTLWNEQAAPTGAGLRTYLDIRASTLRRLPWELSADPTGQHFFIKAENPWVRGSPPFQAVAAPDAGPLRVLIVIGSRDPTLGGDDEVAALLPVIRAADGVAEVLRSPTQDELFAAYRDLRPHVFHFIGHGTILAGSGSVLQLGSDGNPWTLSDHEILNLLPGWTGRLAILNACRTAGGSPTEAHEASATLVEAFRTKGFRAVVGMQADIRSEAAAALSRPFYKALGNGSPIDQALAAARQTLATPALGRRDWALPALHLGTDPAEVILLEKPAPKVSLQATEFNMSASFVGQGPERRRLWTGVDPELFDAKAHGLTLVAGPAGIGKTWLIYHALWICALRGHQVRYVTLTPEKDKSLDFLAVLRRIRDGGGGSPLQGPLLPASAFDRFNHQVNFIATGKEPSPLEPETTPVRDKRKRFKAGVERGRERIIEAFAQALKAAAGKEPLVIALDQTAGVVAGDRKALWDGLLVPAADGQLGPVRLIVDVKGTDLGAWLDQAGPYTHTVFIDPIAIEDFVPLAFEYFTYLGDEVYVGDARRDLAEYFNVYRKTFLHESPWLPERLRRVFDAAKPQ